ADRIHIDFAAVPAHATALEQLVRRVGTAGIDHRQAWDAVDQPVSLQFHERLAKGAAVAQVAAGDDDPVGDLPAKRLEHAKHDRLLSLEPERVDAVDQVDAELFGDLLDPEHRV